MQPSLADPFLVATCQLLRLQVSVAGSAPLGLHGVTIAEVEEPQGVHWIPHRRRI